MIDHIYLPVTDIERSLDFYGADSRLSALRIGGTSRRRPVGRTFTGLAAIAPASG
jgi:catechol 2,3-dioxygenase-like lactoylglutathione lyase family enzyme